MTGWSRMHLGPVPHWGCSMSHSTPIMVAVRAMLAQDTPWITKFTDTRYVIVARHDFYDA